MILKAISLLVSAYLAFVQTTRAIYQYVVDMNSICSSALGSPTSVGSDEDAGVGGEAAASVLPRP